MLPCVSVLSYGQASLGDPKLEELASVPYGLSCSKKLSQACSHGDIKNPKTRVEVQIAPVG